VGEKNTIKKNTETLLQVCRDVGLEVGTQKNKYIAIKMQDKIIIY